VSAYVWRKYKEVLKLRIELVLELVKIKIVLKQEKNDFAEVSENLAVDKGLELILFGSLK